MASKGASQQASSRALEPAAMPCVPHSLPSSGEAFATVYLTCRIGYDGPRILWEETAMAEPGNTLTLETTQGPVVIEMRPRRAPTHVAHIN